eukprot:TRINITY_DN26046_c0_g1_i3.p1 TRINITY_DN26046_c0_g1~~TRINITY_DN26046_c0_g1_i3.p1  ORF type:complete len:174 (+),score=53.52 TRINITY_DN26046_c0_g1_i3:272-793(+)
MHKDPVLKVIANQSDSSAVGARVYEEQRARVLGLEADLAAVEMELREREESARAATAELADAQRALAELAAKCAESVETGLVQKVQLSAVRSESAAAERACWALRMEMLQHQYERLCTSGGRLAPEGSECSALCGSPSASAAPPEPGEHPRRVPGGRQQGWAGVLRGVRRGED